MGVAGKAMFKKLMKKAKKKIQNEGNFVIYVHLVQREAIISSFSFKGSLYIVFLPFFFPGSSLQMWRTVAAYTTAVRFSSRVNVMSCMLSLR